jgi:hypothetical protein
VTGPDTPVKTVRPESIFVTDIPPRYCDWRLISVAHEEGNLNSFATVLGNDLAIQAYREGKVPFPDGAIIAALHYRHLPSEENNKVFGPVPQGTFSLLAKTPNCRTSSERPPSATATATEIVVLCTSSPT